MAGAQPDAVPGSRAPANARSPQVNLRRIAMASGASGVSFPANAHGVLRGARLADMFGLMAWQRQTDHIVALTTEAVTGAAVRRLSDLAVLRSRAARSGTQAFRTICRQIAGEIGGTAPASLDQLLAEIPARSAFEAKPGAGPHDERRIALRPVTGAGDPDGLATTCTLRGLMPPEAGPGGAWVVNVPSIAVLQRILPPAWIPDLGQDLLDELARGSSAYGTLDMHAILRGDPGVRTQACSLAWRMADDTSSTVGVRIPDALQALGLDQAGNRGRDEAAFLARLELVLGGQFAFEPWAAPVASVVVDGGAAGLDRLSLLWEDLYAGVSDNRGTGRSTALLVDGRLLTHPALWTLTEDGLRLGRKCSLGILVACTPDTPPHIVDRVRVFGGFALQIQDDRTMILDTDQNQPEPIGTLPQEGVRCGQDYLLTGEMRS